MIEIDSDANKILDEFIAASNVSFPGSKAIDELIEEKQIRIKDEIAAENPRPTILEVKGGIRI